MVDTIVRAIKTAFPDDETHDVVGRFTRLARTMRTAHSLNIPRQVPPPPQIACGA